MRKGLGMWVMSKMVMFIFLFSLVTTLGAYYAIYQDKVISDTGKKVTQSIAEQITDAIAYKRTTRTIWLAPSMVIRDIQKGYTIKVTYTKQSDDVGRLAIFLAWNDQQDPTTFASASAVDFVIGGNVKEKIDHVCFYEIPSDAKESEDLVQIKGDSRSDDGLVIRPSAPLDERQDYLLVYKTRVMSGGSLVNKVCLGAKSFGVDLKTAMELLANECDSKCTDRA